MKALCMSIKVVNYVRARNALLLLGLRTNYVVEVGDLRQGRRARFVYVTS
jgi:hypothetical protein